MNTYRGYSYDMEAGDTWFFVDDKGNKRGGYSNDDACMDAIDAYKKAQRLAQPA